MIDQRLTDIVKLRFFAGLTIPQTAQAINVSLRTVERDRLRAQAWLISHLLPPPEIQKRGNVTKDDST